MEQFLGQVNIATMASEVMTGERLMQAAGDIFFGWQRIKGFDGMKPPTTTFASFTTRRKAST